MRIALYRFAHAGYSLTFVALERPARRANGPDLPDRRGAAIDHQPIALAATLVALDPVKNSRRAAMVARMRQFLAHSLPVEK